MRDLVSKLPAQFAKNQVVHVCNALDPECYEPIVPGAEVYTGPLIECIETQRDSPALIVYDNICFSTPQTKTCLDYVFRNAKIKNKKQNRLHFV